METTWLHSMVQGDETQYYRKRDGIMVEHMVRPANFDMRYNHFHQEYEIYLLLRGKRQMFFENRAYEACAGNLILVDSGQIHMSHSIPGDPEPEYERIILYVDKAIVEQADKIFPELKIGAFFHKHYGIYELTPEETEQTRRLFLQVMDEMDKAQPMSQTAIFSELVLGFIRFRRSNQQVPCLSDARKGAASGGKFGAVYQAADYISDHFQEPISLDALAEQFYISKYYLSRSFREVTGFGISEYINILRVQRAQNLLQTTALSISEIASRTGFESITYFERVFKRYQRITPAQYRKSLTGQGAEEKP